MWCQKLAWVSPARPRLPSDSKSLLQCLKGVEWALLIATTNPTISRAWCCRAPKQNELPSFRVTVAVCPSSQSSLGLTIDSCSTRLQYIALLDAGPDLLLQTILGVGEV